MKRLFAIAFMMIAVIFLSGEIACSYNINVWVLQSRKYEDGTEHNELGFGVFDSDWNAVMENVVQSVQLYDPDDNEIPLNADLNESFYLDYMIRGTYDPDTGQWNYADNFENTSGYGIQFQGTLKEGTYRIAIIDNDSNEYELTKEFYGATDLPVFSSETFHAHRDESGNLHWTWGTPKNIDPKLETRLYAEISAESSGSVTLWRYIGIWLPPHMGYLYVPNLTLQAIGAENDIKIRLKFQTKDGSTRTYSKALSLEEASTPLIDVNGDGKTGLEEAIHSLKVASGVE